jgi:PAS domain S-box-containing protein
MSGPDKKPTYFNRAWLEFTGRSIETELGEGVAVITHPDDYAQCHMIYTTAFDARRPLKKECRLRRHDGEYRWVLDVGVPRFVADGSFAGYIGTCTDVTDHKRAQEALSTLNQQLIRAHEAERTQIARELHDDINQRLAILAIQLEGVKKRLPASLIEPTSQIDAAITQVVELSEDVEALSRGLSSPKLDLLGLAAAAKSFCRDFSEREHVAIHFESDHIPRDLSHDLSLCLYRVLQEAVHNARKHSGTPHVHVSLIGTSHDITLTVQDFGRGFLPTGTTEGRGMGLASMQERLRLIGGQLSIASTLQSGTTIYAQAPLDSRVGPA